jgi:hypothetical protein
VIAVAADGFLPPVVIEIAINDTAALAKLTQFKASMAETTASLDKNAAGISSGMSRAEGDAATAAGGIHGSAGSIGKDLEGIGVGAAAGGRATESAIKDASSAVSRGEEDIASKSGSFSSRVGNMFSGLGNSMGKFGIPFGHGVTKMGEDMKSAETKGSSFASSLGSIAQAGAAAGLLLAVGIGVASVKAADQFDVAQTRLRTAVTDTGHSFAQFEPAIKKSESNLTNLGFTTTETAQSLGTLTVSTKSPAKAMGEMGLAADLARYKNISLAQASETLAKVNAGSLRPLMQLGIQLDIGSTKLTAQVKATEAVTKAKTALKAAEEAMAAAVVKGSEEHKAAVEKVTAAEDSLKQAQETLKGGSEGLVAAQTSLREAQKGVTEAAQKQKLAVKEAAAALKSAEESAKEAAESGAKGVEGAKKNLSSLETERGKEANESAIKTIENEEKVLEATKTAASEAALVQLRSKKASLEATDKSIEAGKKEAQLQEAHKGIIEAEAIAHKNNKTAITAVATAHEKLIKAQQEAIHGSKESQTAANSLASAQRGVASAERTLATDQAGVQKATAAVAIAQVAEAQSSKTVETAQAKLAAAHEKLSEAEKKLQKDQVATGTVLGALKQKIGGTAAAFGQTLAGQTDIAKAKLNAIAVEIGTKLTPILLTLIDSVKTVAHALVPLWQGFVSGVQWVGKEAANLDIAWERNWGHVQDIVKVVHFLVVGWIIDLGKVLFGVAVKIGEYIVKIVGFFVSLPGKVIGALSGLVSDMENLGKNLITALINGITSAPGAIVNAIKGLMPGGIIGKAASLIGLAAGGIVTKPTLAVVGEAGPEAVIPLSGLATSPSSVAPLARSGTAAPSTAGLSGGSSGLHVGEINLYGEKATSAELVQQVYLALRPMLNATG